MSDYEKLKVTELKTLLKERDIAGTGLTKKAQYIQALEEEDAKAASAPAEEPEDAAEASKDAAVSTEAASSDEAKAEVTTQSAQEVAADQSDSKPSNKTDVEDQTLPDAEPAVLTDRKRKRDPSPIQEEAAQGSTPKKPKNEKDEEEEKEEVDRKPDVTTAARDVQAGDISRRSSSLHEPTAALYIKNLMRPLQLSLFRDHLSSLAAADASQASDAVTQIHLDAMKTHAFVVFDSVAAAERVRDGLHDKIWPAESQRKALWVDFVTVDAVSDWIDQENTASRDTRFEVAYSESDPAGVTVATLREIGSRSQQRPAQSQGHGAPGAPQRPRGQRQDEPAHDTQDRRSAEPPKQSQQQGGSFSKLDQYFSFTTAKPKIYFKPVEDELARSRLAELDRETSRDWQAGRAWNRSTQLAPIDQLRRYTFEDGDRVVDGGADFGGFGKRQFAGGTGPFIPGGPPRGGGRGGRGGGGYRGGY